MVSLDNMQLDRQLFEKAEQGTALPLVRAYTWEFSSITYGYNQKIEELIDPNQYKGWQVFKRPTGGGIVFHQVGEISFSMVLSRDGLNVPQAVAQTSKRVADYLKGLGMKIKVSESKHSHRANFCTDFISSYEITFDGKKLVGIAQRFGKKSILQQGTMFGNYPEIKTRELEECLKSL